MKTVDHDVRDGAHQNFRKTEHTGAGLAIPNVGKLPIGPEQFATPPNRQVSLKKEFELEVMSTAADLRDLATS